jgi:hypothetical protein
MRNGYSGIKSTNRMGFPFRQDLLRRCRFDEEIGSVPTIPLRITDRDQRYEDLMITPTGVFPP